MLAFKKGNNSDNKDSGRMAEENHERCILIKIGNHYQSYITSRDKTA